MTSRIQQASLQWDAQGLPCSLDYGDIYFSRADALGESTHVFLDGNQLQTRWRSLSAAHFIIGETGFGTGLNFLNACRLWASTTDGDATLHYVSCELHPVSREDMERWHAGFPQLGEWSKLLLLQYSGHTAGVQQFQLTLGKHRVLLTLLLGDALPMFNALNGITGFRVDAWFLDGFAPRLNPGLWNTALFRSLAALSDNNTTLATYSVAGSIRQGLLEAGFSVEKVPGFASKKEMLIAGYRTTIERSPLPENEAVCVVGGGLAGCSTAYALACSGVPVTVLEKEQEIAAHSSGNPQGILHFRPVKSLAHDHHFNLQAYLHASCFYRSLAASKGLDWHACGHLQLAHDENQAKRFREILLQQQYADPLMQLLSPEEASSIAGVKVLTSALFFPDSGWISPPALCSFYLDHPRITVMRGQQVLNMEKDITQWQLEVKSASGTSTTGFNRVVLCNSADVHFFRQTRHLPVISNRGQVDVYAAGADATRLRTVVCGQSYLVPASNGLQSAGGSYFLGDHSGEGKESRRVWHLEKLAAMSPLLADSLENQTLLMQRSGTRCITPDRLPLTGELAQYPGLFLNIGHGSHGLTRTPFAAALLASLITGTPPPMNKLHAQMLNPSRYPQ